MTQKTLYKKGYLIRVTSWENDADNYNTKEMNVADEESARQIVELCWLHTSKNNSKSKGIGNIYEPRDSEEELVNSTYKTFLDKYPNFFDEKPKDPSYLIDWLGDFLYDLGLRGGDFYTRVCEKVEVMHFDNDVICEDLSEEFK